MIDRYIRTASGRKFSIHKMDIDIDDIAEALSHIFRYNGHMQQSWSVAQHSIVVSDIVGTHSSDKKVVLSALLHDASEAYLPDVPSPFKSRLRDYVYLEGIILREIFKKFGLEFPYSDIVHKVDKRIADWEMFSFRPEWKEHKRDYKLALSPQPPSVCKAMFLDRFAALSK